MDFKKIGSVTRTLILLAILGLVNKVSATIDTLASEIGSLAGNPLGSLIPESGLKSEFENVAQLVEQVKDGPLGKLGGGSPKDIKEPFLSPQMPMGIMPMGIKPMYMGIMPIGIKPMYGAKKLLKTAPLKKVILKKAVKAKVLVPKVKVPLIALKKKPKVYELEPIVHIIEKPVAVYHKVPVPKKVLVPKFYPVYKPIPVPKFIPVPIKVPIKKIIPKIVKIPKPFIVKKFIPVKKPIPIGIPYPVPKFYKVPIPKLVPYPKYIPIPIKKKVPKFIPVPVKKIIKVPKPYYVPVKVPYITTSYMKTPMVVKVPNVKKKSFKKGAFSGVKKFPLKSQMASKEGFPKGLLNFISDEDIAVKSYKLKDSAQEELAKFI